ncbi:hypothetical protein ACERK3_05925 [Phycisphaerales bacterium AB-hyl4]|uniref:SHOCT domain-containing protein n=1 Tax=Natronomicrosphaera hydrolytica TaxID=3242702 RepID=A0ABV4U2S9_9BACT
MSQAVAIIMLPMPLLGQADGGGPTGRIFWSVLTLAVAVIVLVSIALVIRRFMLSRDEPTRMPGFTLSDMRRLHAAGELSDEEFERVRSAMIGQARGEGSGQVAAPPGQKPQSGAIPPPPPAESDSRAEGETGESPPLPPDSTSPDSDKPA